MHRHAVELRPLNESDDDLLSSLEQQDDVWEFIGTLPVPDAERAHHLFAIMDGETSLGIAGLVRSPALDGSDYELLCAMRSEAQMHGFAKQACRLVLAWSFDTAKLKRVIACIDDSNEGARSIAASLGMKALCAGPPHRTVYVKYRDEHSSGKALKPLMATLVALAFPVATAGAQLSPVTFAGLPVWADSALRAAGLGTQYRFTSNLNTAYELGDFDRDGLVDVAVEIVDTGGLRCGIAIVHRIDRSVHVVGAGQPVGNGRDRLACRGSWGVASEHGHRHHSFMTDLIYVTEPGAEARSGWLVWDGRSYVWTPIE